MNSAEAVVNERENPTWRALLLSLVVVKVMHRSVFLREPFPPTCTYDMYWVIRRVFFRVSGGFCTSVRNVPLLPISAGHYGKNGQPPFPEGPMDPLGDCTNYNDTSGCRGAFEKRVCLFASAASDMYYTHLLRLARVFLTQGLRATCRGKGICRDRDISRQGG